MCHKTELFEGHHGRHIVVLTDRLHEDLLRTAWEHLMDDSPVENGFQRMTDLVDVVEKPSTRPQRRRRPSR